MNDKPNPFSVQSVLANAQKNEIAVLRQRLTVHVARQGLIRKLCDEFQKQCNELPAESPTRGATEQVLRMFEAVIDGKHDPKHLKRKEN